MDVLFTDANVSPDDHRRPQRRNALAALATGDTLIVWSMANVARSLDELLELLQQMRARGIVVRFVSEGLEFSPGSPETLGRDLALLAAGHGLLKASTRERQRVGIEKAMRSPRKYNGAKLKLTVGELQRLRVRLQGLPKNQKDSITKIAKDFGISRQTVYRYQRAGAALVEAAKQIGKAAGQRKRGNTSAARATEASATVKRRAALKAGEVVRTADALAALLAEGADD